MLIYEIKYASDNNGATNYEVVLGDSFFQQFYAEFQYIEDDVLVNTMTLSLTDYSLPGTYIGNHNAPVYVPVPPVVPTPNNNTSNDEPVTPVVPSASTGMSSGVVIMISGGSLVLVLLIVLIVICVVGNNK